MGGPGGLALVAALAALAALVPGMALAHGGAEPRPGPATLVTGWEFDPLFLGAVAATTWAYVAGVRSIGRAHPASPFPRRRVAFFLGGMGALVVAIASPLAAYDTTLFSAHMVQHLLIAMVAAPLLLLGMPITLALRAASARVRRGLLLPVLHSRAVKMLAFPVVAWVIFVLTMWVTHFSPLFNEALEDGWLHRLEHSWYLAAGLLFWWPAITADPGPWRMNHPVRLLYLFLQMPQNSFLGTAIYSSDDVLYRHYEMLTRAWGPSALSDQQLAGVIMWVGGDLIFLIALALVAYGWVQHEERRTRVDDRARARVTAGRLAGDSAGRGEGAS
ncbi:MAG: cytochrome c oxidase assembly protein [Tepidiformaceae bacterium]